MIPGLCEVTEPPLAEVEPGHLMSCHIPLEELRRLQQRGGELVVGAEETQAREAIDLRAEGGQE
jgi:peptide/nickel transport system ATP-binding protein